MPATRGHVLRSDATFTGGTQTAASIELPGSWVQLTQRPDRVQWAGPDNFSTVMFTLHPMTGDAAKCPELARHAADEAQHHLEWTVILANDIVALTSQWRWPTVTDQKVSSPNGTPEIVDFELQAPGPVPGPSERTVLGRVICKNGGIVEVACSTGHLKTETLDACRQIIASVTVEGPPPAPQQPAAAPSQM
jgi:hypothetical protein